MCKLFTNNKNIIKEVSECLKLLELTKMREVSVVNINQTILMNLHRNINYRVRK